MTITEMIRQLQEMLDHGTDPDSVVEAYDPEDGGWLPVTGMGYGLGTVELFTDEP